MDKDSVLKLLASPIAYYAILAKISGGVTAGVFLSQLIYWTGRGKQADGWIWKSADEMESETGLTRTEQETARRKLKDRGFIAERLAGVPATLHYRVDLDAIMRAIAQFDKKPESSLAKSVKPDSTKVTNLLGENSQTIHRLSETTTETTSQETMPGGIGAEAPATSIQDVLEPSSSEEILLFDLLTQAQISKNRRPPRRRFQNPVQAQTFRDAVKVLNGQTESVLRRFFIGGSGGLGNAVAYVVGAARKRGTAADIEILEPVEVL